VFIYVVTKIREPEGVCLVVVFIPLNRFVA